MTTKSFKVVGVTLLALVLAVVAVMGVAAQDAQPQVERAGEVEILTFDVAEDTTRFIFDEAPVFEEDGYPAFGNSFITQGYIYPAGTLDGTNGVLPNGEPEFPELVLGEWTCRGYFVGDGAHTTEGPMVITTQVYNFGEEYGSQMLVTEGYEFMSSEAITRAITGGTGDYVGARGQGQQTFLGLNVLEGVSLTFELEVQK